MLQSDLFASAAPSKSPTAFEAAWQGWLASEQRAGRVQLNSSVVVYASVWHALSVWCTDERYDLHSLDAAGLERFLASRGSHGDISMRHSWRVLRLVDRVLQHYARTRDVVPNRAAAALLEMRPQYRFANAASKDPLPEFLHAQEAKLLVTYLCAVRPGRSASGAIWQEIRNRCSVGLMLGSGATPGEVRALRVTDVVIIGGRRTGIPWKLRIDGHSTTPARESPLAAWAGQLLAYWLQIRAEQAIPGGVLLPSTRAGKSWSKVSHYKATGEVLTAAGVDDVEGGSFRLRHTFALRQLKKGSSPGEVSNWLGVSDPSVMKRYKRVLTSPVDVF